MTTTTISVISATIAFCSLVSNIILSKINFARQTLPFIQVKVIDNDEVEEGWVPDAIIDHETNNGQDVSVYLNLKNVGLGLARDIIIQYDNGIEKNNMAPRKILSKDEETTFLINIYSEDIDKQPNIRVFYKSLLGDTYMTELKCGQCEFKKVFSQNRPKTADVKMRYDD